MLTRSKRPGTKDVGRDRCNPLKFGMLVAVLLCEIANGFPELSEPLAGRVPNPEQVLVGGGIENN